MRVTKKQLVSCFGRMLVTGYKSDAVSTKHLMEEIAFTARLSGEDGTEFLKEVMQHRDELLANAGLTYKR